MTQSDKLFRFALQFQAFVLIRVLSQARVVLVQIGNLLDEGHTARLGLRAAQQARLLRSVERLSEVVGARCGPVFFGNTPPIVVWLYLLLPHLDFGNCPRPCQAELQRVVLCIGHLLACPFGLLCEIHILALPVSCGDEKEK